MLAEVRSFNRTVTERIGALEGEYLAHGRPLGASRVLWEIDAEADVRALRTRLGLDSGYLSRLLRTLEAEGLVTVAADEHDRRVRTARLTAAGRAERARLDADSDALAASLLAPLSEAQQLRLVQAMGVVERLLTAGLVEVAPADPRERRRPVLRARVLRRPAGALRLRRRAHAARRRHAAARRPPARRADRLWRRSSPARATSSACGSRRTRAGSGSGAAS